MHSGLTKYQEKLLTDLISKYEDSKTYAGTNLVNQSFYRKPAQIFNDYNNDFTDVDLVNDFEEQMKELEERSLIRLEWKDGIIVKIYAVPDSWDRINELLKREDKNKQIQKQITYLSAFSGIHPILDAFCQDEIKRLQDGKKPTYEPSEVSKLLEMLKAILLNQQELLERELSISIFGDSKLFEKSYRTKICKLLEKYGQFASLLEGIDDRREREKVLLEEFNIYANPAYIYIKGNARVILDNGSIIQLSTEIPIALSTPALQHVIKIQIETESIMTIENLTSFNRMSDDSYFYIFLSGYHNSSKQKLLVRLYEQNPNHTWLHFGDLDPDGFYILEHLMSNTKIPFTNYHMMVEDLIKYHEYTKPLEKNDIAKAKSLINQGLYLEQMKYMLDHNCKLEQEIISIQTPERHWGRGNLSVKS